MEAYTHGFEVDVGVGKGTGGVLTTSASPPKCGKVRLEDPGDCGDLVYVSELD